MVIGRQPFVTPVAVGFGAGAGSGPKNRLAGPDGVVSGAGLSGCAFSRIESTARPTSLATLPVCSSTDTDCLPPGPGTPEEALRWIQDALREGRYTPGKHFGERLLERAIDMLDVFHAVENASSIAPYVPESGPQHDGTPWRIVGPPPDDEGDPIGVGVEAYLDKKRRRVYLTTVFKVTG